MSEIDSERLWRSDTETVDAAISHGQCGSAVLLELFGEAPGRVIEIKRTRTFVGREGASFSGSTVQIAHPSVSRQHAVLVRDESGFSIRDLGSTNGTYVNGHKTAVHSLYHGDLLKLGRTVFRVIVDHDLESAVSAEQGRLLRVDPLTQVLNRAAFLEEVRLHLAVDAPVCVLVGVIQEFDAHLTNYPAVANDHLVGGLAQVLSRRVFDQQQIGRIAPTAFAVLAPRRSLKQSREIGHSLTRHVGATEFTLDGQSVPVSICFDAAERTPGCTAESLLDTAMERALNPPAATLV